MGIAILSAARLVQVMPVWIDWLAPRLSPSGSRLQRGAAGRGRQATRPSGAAGWAERLRERLGGWRPSGRVAGPAIQVRTPAHPRPLRVLRVLDPQQPRAAAGRMVISGRMADVCAELDRLAAAEVEATHPKR